MDDTIIPLNLYLNYIIKAYDKFIKSRIKDPEIDPVEIPFIIGIYHNEGASQSEISSSFRVSEAYVTKMLNKLQKKDLIKKEYDNNNKTRKLIYLTNQGKDVYYQSIEIIKEWETHLTSDLEDNEIEEFEKTLIKISEKSNEI